MRGLLSLNNGCYRLRIGVDCPDGHIDLGKQYIKRIIHDVQARLIQNGLYYHNSPIVALPSLMGKAKD